MSNIEEQNMQKLVRSINDATREAYAAMVSSNDTIVGDIFANKENSRSVSNDGGDGLSSPLSSGGDNDNRAGMEMGIALFGTTDTYKSQMDEEFRDKLLAVEKELNDIRAGLHLLKNNGNIDATAGDLDRSDSISMNITGGCGDDNGLCSIDMIPHLQNHIQFLQHCAQARKLLDDVEKLSFTNFATSSVGGSGTTTDHVNNSSVSFLLSPSAQFSFEPLRRDILKDGKSPMVQAAYLVNEVDGILEKATRTLSDDYIGSSSSPLTQMQAKILNELQIDARRFRSELKHRAITIIDRSIVVEEGKLLVKGSGTASNRDRLKRTDEFIDAAMDSPSHDTKSISTSPLSDAYEVLDSFSDQRFAPFGESLEITMKKLAQKITGVFKARMTTFESALANGEVAMFITREETVNKTRRKIGNRYDFANVLGGSSIQLLWTLTMVEYEEQVVDNYDDDDATSIDTSTNIVSAEIDEKLLQSAPTVQIATFLSLLNYLSNLFTFIYDHVLLGRPELSKILGKHLFGTESSASSSSTLRLHVLRLDEGILMIDILEAMRKWCIPESSSPQVWKMIKRVERRLIKEVGIFEDAMGSMKFMNGSSIHGADSPIVNTDSPLSKLANSLCQAYVSAQRCQIINTGRNILINTDYHNTTCVGHRVKDPAQPGTLESLNDDPHSIFLFHECSVSVTAQEILQLCRKTLDAASNQEAATIIDILPPSLYRASRELLDLFRAIIPTLHGKEISSIPRMAAVLHNDCVYLAHEASFLGAEYKEKFNKLAGSMHEPSKMKLLSEVCTFVDMVPLFRDLASKSMGSMIETQKVQLYELVSPRLVTFTAALGSNESVSEWDDAEIALKAALHHLRHLSQVWKKVLSRNVYNIALGNLVDTAFILFLEPVLKAKEISDQASRFVNFLFIEAVKSSAELFRTDETLVDAEVLSKIAAKHAVEFGKLQAVGQFMVMRLDDVERGLGDGTFRCLRAKELSHLIAAAFDESDKRRRLINSLTSK